MNGTSNTSSARTFVELTDEEHTLILLIRTMPLNEIMCMQNFSKFLPEELPDKSHHIMNIINVYFRKSYEIHTVRSMMEFISTHPTYEQTFQLHSVKEMIERYQAKNIAESINVHELYLRPFTTECIQCKAVLKPVYKHRSKTVMSLTVNYKARK